MSLIHPANKIFNKDDSLEGEGYGVGRKMGESIPNRRMG